MTVVSLKVKLNVNKITRQRLLTRLGYEFNDNELCQLALTHRSYGNPNNERLEFLGDSILNFVVGEDLFRRFPEAKEGQLSRLRAQLVKGETLAEISREFEIGENLILGEGEMKSGGFRRDSILADVVEALIGAIHLDSGPAASKDRVLAWYHSRLEAIRLDDNPKDAKTQLQELLQSRKKPLPEYKVIEVTGEAHAQMFSIACHCALLKKPTQAEASSRRVAEKKAAAKALILLQPL